MVSRYMPLPTGTNLGLIWNQSSPISAARRWRNVFSDHELMELRALPAELGAEGFFACWTRKEAYVKARGDGLQIPLNSFDVSLTPGRPAELHSPDSARWNLRSFQPAPRFVAAVVGEGGGWRLRHFEWAP